MQYHELRLFVPAEGENGRVIGGVEASRIAHDALAPVIAAQIDDTAPVMVMWERMVTVAASGAL